MKFTLLEPCDYNFYYNNMSGPLGLAYVASFLDQELDNSVQTSIETDVDYVIKTKPDFVGISAYTQNFNKAIHAAKKIKKELNIPVIIGGKHITALPETLPDCFDLGVVGDGERTMADIMKTFIDTKGLRPEDLVNIQGVTFKDDGKSIITPQRDALKDLDFLPPPKRSILHAY
ncbi:MAG: B12-binding domain-containing radical SAM protein, partial [Candidatus Sericytochromatia bacterium]